MSLARFILLIFQGILLCLKYSFDRCTNVLTYFPQVFIVSFSMIILAKKCYKNQSPNPIKLNEWGGNQVLQAHIPYKFWNSVLISYICKNLTHFEWASMILPKVSPPNNKVKPDDVTESFESFTYLKLICSGMGGHQLHKGSTYIWRQVLTCMSNMYFYLLYGQVAPKPFILVYKTIPIFFNSAFHDKL